MKWKKTSASTAVSSSSSGQMSLSREQAESFADRLADRVERSDGQYELDAYIRQGTESHGTPYTQQG
ncbi:8938_t:CDS:1, partial [Entrophospora sp. SA101]